MEVYLSNSCEKQNKNCFFLEKNCLYLKILNKLKLSFFVQELIRVGKANVDLFICFSNYLSMNEEISHARSYIGMYL